MAKSLGSNSVDHPHLCSAFPSWCALKSFPNSIKSSSPWEIFFFLPNSVDTIINFNIKWVSWRDHPEQVALYLWCALPLYYYSSQEEQELPTEYNHSTGTVNSFLIWRIQFNVQRIRSEWPMDFILLSRSQLFISSTVIVCHLRTSVYNSIKFNSVQTVSGYSVDKWHANRLPHKAEHFLWPILALVVVVIVR